MFAQIIRLLTVAGLLGTGLYYTAPSIMSQLRRAKAELRAQASRGDAGSLSGLRNAALALIDVIPDERMVEKTRRSLRKERTDKKQDKPRRTRRNASNAQTFVGNGQGSSSRPIRLPRHNSSATKATPKQTAPQHRPTKIKLRPQDK